MSLVRATLRSRTRGGRSLGSRSSNGIAVRARVVSKLGRRTAAGAASANPVTDDAIAPPPSEDTDPSLPSSHAVVKVHRGDHRARPEVHPMRVMCEEPGLDMVGAAPGGR